MITWIKYKMRKSTQSQWMYMIAAASYSVYRRSDQITAAVITSSVEVDFVQCDNKVNKLIRNAHPSRYKRSSTLAMTWGTFAHTYAIGKRRQPKFST